MKIYKCDSCGVEIKNPFIEKMKEFCLASEIDEYGIFPAPWKKKTKIHLCKDCFIGLYILEKRKNCEMVHTNDILIRKSQKYEVAIADDNIFVVCPVVYDTKEGSEIVKYEQAEIYANQEKINTLEDLGFEIWKKD